jgi:hypothetical protein
MSIGQEQRPKYYEGQYLGAADLEAAVIYARLREARHLLGAHTWGIAAGLQLQEVPPPGGGTGVNMFVRPGYAWDGFGRPIVVLAPYPIPPVLFQSFVYDPANPNGVLVDVWLVYDESRARPPQPGFELCSSDDQSSRVVETFHLEIGPIPTNQQRDPISVAGRSIDASMAYRSFDANDGLLNDGSVPFQSFPSDDGVPARWLIPLGKVRWQPNKTPGQPGNFAKRSQQDLDASQRQRVYIGVVAGSVFAADGSIRLANRTQADATPPPVSDDLVWVEGTIRARGDIRLWNTRIDFRDAKGDSQSRPCLIDRSDDAGSGTTGLIVQIGAAPNGKTRFGVGPLKSGGTTVDEKFVVLDNGNVGIGTTSPSQPLEVAGNLYVTGHAIKPGGGSWSDKTSDVSLKQNIRRLDNALEQLLRLRGVSFEWKDPESVGNLTGPQLGLIAQEVEGVFPGWVSTRSDGLKQVTVRGFEALTIEAFRDLQKQVTVLQARVEVLEGKQHDGGGGPPGGLAQGQDQDSPRGGRSK